MRTLVLFHEINTSLKSSERCGLLVRNMLQYQKFGETGSISKIYYWTYDRTDRNILSRLKAQGNVPQELELLCPPRWVKGRRTGIIYSVIGPLLHRGKLAEADVLKTQQVSGSWTAFIAKLLFGTPLMFRVGYPLSKRFETEGKRFKRALALAVEKLLLRYADHVAVTSLGMQRYYGRHVAPEKITLLPNYVDVSGFTPIEHYSKYQPLLFVGRLVEVKNLSNLIRACARIDMSLHLYGAGPLKEELRSLAADCGAEVSFKGSVSNTELMRVHHEHTFYILCSTREGMPKALIEAMASALICISTRTDGGLELIEDGKTGYLIDGFDEQAIAEKLAEVRETFDSEIGGRASAFVRKNNSIDSAVELELRIFDKICAKPEMLGAQCSPSALHDEPSEEGLMAVGFNSCNSAGMPVKTTKDNK